MFPGQTPAPRNIRIFHIHRDGVYLQHFWSLEGRAEAEPDFHSQPQNAQIPTS